MYADAYEGSWEWPYSRTGEGEVSRVRVAVNPEVEGMIVVLVGGWMCWWVRRREGEALCQALRRGRVLADGIGQGGREGLAAE